MKREMRFLLIVLAQVVGVGTAQGAKNIFEDDWQPAKPVTAPKPVPAVKPQTPAANPATPKDPANSAETPKPGTPVDPAPSVAPPPAPSPELSAAVVARKAIPEKAKQAEVRKLMKEVYAGDLADRSVSGRKKLTQSLIAQANKSSDSSPVEQFVLLVAAVDSAVDSANLPLAFTAIDQLAQTFEVEALDMKTDVATAFRPGPRAEAAGAAPVTENVQAVLLLADQLVEVEALQAAQRVCTTIQPVAGSNTDLRAQVQKRIRDLTITIQATERVAKDTQTLKASPDDPAANLSMGKYKCFIRGDWEGGLRMLAKGSDAALKAVATQELAAKEPSAEATLALADSWWDLSVKQTDAGARAAIASHAAGLYQSSLSAAVGLRKAQVEKRIAEAGKTPAVASIKPSMAAPARKTGAINLIPLFDLRSPVAGNWTIQNGALVCDQTRNARIQSSYRPPAEYDFLIEFTRLKTSASFVQLISHGDTAFEWTVSAETRFSNVNGHARNGTQKKAPESLADLASRHTSLVQVRNSGVKVLIDGKEVIDYTAGYETLSRNGAWKMQDDRFLGLGSWGDPIAFHRVEVTEVLASKP